MSSYKINDLIAEMEMLLELSDHKTFSRSKIIVDQKELEGMIGRLKEVVPQEIQSCKNVLDHKGGILNDAHRDAEKILKDAQIKAKKLVNETEIMRESYKEADNIIYDAKEEADEIIHQAQEKANGIIQEALEKADGELRAAREKMNYETNQIRQETKQEAHSVREEMRKMRNETIATLNSLIEKMEDETTSCTAEICKITDSLTSRMSEHKKIMDNAKCAIYQILDHHEKENVREGKKDERPTTKAKNKNAGASSEPKKPVALNIHSKSTPEPKKPSSSMPVMPPVPKTIPKATLDKTQVKSGKPNPPEPVSSQKEQNKAQMTISSPAPDLKQETTRDSMKPGKKSSNKENSTDRGKQECSSGVTESVPLIGTANPDR